MNTLETDPEVLKKVKTPLSLKDWDAAEGVIGELRRSVVEQLELEATEVFHSRRRGVQRGARFRNEGVRSVDE
jgi:hypothetical protein